MIGKLFQSLAGGLLGQLGEKIGSWIPDKDQRYRQKREALEKEINELQDAKNAPLTRDQRDLLVRRLEQLRQVEDYLKTR